MINSYETDTVQNAIKTAIQISYEQLEKDNLIPHTKEKYNEEILKIAELLILANHNSVVKDKLGNITIYLAELSRK